MLFCLGVFRRVEGKDIWYLTSLFLSYLFQKVKHWDCCCWDYWQSQVLKYEALPLWHCSVWDVNLLPDLVVCVRTTRKPQCVLNIYLKRAKSQEWGALPLLDDFSALAILFQNRFRCICTQCTEKQLCVYIYKQHQYNWYIFRPFLILSYWISVLSAFQDADWMVVNSVVW